MWMFEGGGYQYRLCPVSEPLTEECFQKYPLDFVKDAQAVVFPNGSTVSVKNPVFVTEGVLPVNSTW